MSLGCSQKTRKFFPSLRMTSISFSRSQRRRLFAAFQLIPLSLLLAGCSGRDDKLVPIEGIVKLNGKPLAGVNVYLVPEGLTGRAASARTGEDGSFQLNTSGKDGIARGSYKVLVKREAPPTETAEGAGTADDLAKYEMAAKQKMATRTGPDGAVSIPPEYGRISTTPLRCVIEPGSNRLEFDLRSPPPGR
jgi:hypothetical protein